MEFNKHIVRSAAIYQTFVICPMFASMPWKVVFACEGACASFALYHLIPFPGHIQCAYIPTSSSSSGSKSYRTTYFRYQSCVTVRIHSNRETSHLCALYVWMFLCFVPSYWVRDKEKWWHIKTIKWISAPYSARILPVFLYFIVFAVVVCFGSRNRIAQA